MGFNPRSPRGGATIKFVKSSIVLILFQSTLPTRGSDFNFRSFFKPDYGFNPRSPRGGATFVLRRLLAADVVSIHAPHEGERRTARQIRLTGDVVSIHAPHEGERHRPAGQGNSPCTVSIHAPHEGERHYRGGLDRPLIMVSIHAPHEGERPHSVASRVYMSQFQSTLPTRGSDQFIIGKVRPKMRFNPRSPRGGATFACRCVLQHRHVSIHAPHEGERLAHSLQRLSSKSGFNPRSPRGGATRVACGQLRTGWGFNPRSPRGGATAEKCICMQHFREFTEYYPLRHGDACCIAPQDCIIQAFFGAKKRCFYVRLCFALKNKGVRG